MSEYKVTAPPEHNVNPEPKEGEPKIVLEFYFAGHGYAADLNHLKDGFARADIYVSEASGWTAEDIQTVNDISAGQKRPRALDKSKDEWDFQDAEEAMIYNSHKPVVFIDLPAGDEREEIDRQADSIANQAFPAYIRGNFGEARAAIMESLNSKAFYIDQKDMYMAAQLKNVKRLLNLFPELNKKDQIRVAIQLGTTHKGVAKKVAAGMQVVEHVDEALLSYDEQIIEKITRGQVAGERALSDVLIEDVIFKVATPTTVFGAKSTRERLAIVRKIVERIPKDVNERICERVGADVARLNAYTNDTLVKLIVRKAIEDEIGVRFPLHQDEYAQFKVALGVE